MTQTRYDDMVASYLDELTVALAGLPRARRTELLDDIAGHIDALLGEAAAEGPLTRDVVHAVLAEIGDPADIAGAAGAEILPMQGPTRWDKAIIAILLVGGILLPVVGWLIGVVMLWVSSAWRVKDKVIGTLLVPGGLLLPLVLVFVGGFAPQSQESCSNSPSSITGTSAVDGHQTVVQTSGGVHCTGGGIQVVALVVFLLVLAVAVIGPFVGASWLSRHARREPATA